jgi:hypothetical protein
MLMPGMGYSADMKEQVQRRDDRLTTTADQHGPDLLEEPVWAGRQASRATSWLLLPVSPLRRMTQGWSASKRT